MKASRIRRRLAGAAAVTALAGTALLAGAPMAAAKANLIAINKIALDAPGLRVNVTYSCDPGMHHELVANAEQITSSKPAARGAGTIKTDQLVCDYADHTAQVRLRPADIGFAKGQTVKVTVFYFDEDGFRYADREATATL
ncbi:hypothetical protein ADL22_02375 [Streptomyces sp. NRRL F-4489]|uniref:hypothetical protein n=1 Tax=Streptomyces sp. NRRL F-4489 TaxID=1609095 RepID=UPI00074A629D|nr:hypothetical protein [Streptomyces sp. NRRL F-4489]KUL54799.1 hypothetical protein ADL22_02375 [Streptomyces sp. NRRL F-4489]